MRSALFLFLAQTRVFWRARGAVSYLVFVGSLILFGMRSRIKEESTTTISLLSLLRLTLRDLILAILLAVVLQAVDPHLSPWFTALGFTIPKQSDYGTLLATVIGVGGVFIGLYYAAISAIGSRIYATVPNNIRDLFARERIGSAYMRFLAVLTYFGVCLLAFHSVGLAAVISAVPLFLIAAGLAIIGFGRLGTRAFYLFDPTILSNRLFEELDQCHTQVQAGSYRWADRSFQVYAHRMAQASVDTLTTVADLTAHEEHLNGHPFAGLCGNLLSFLLGYAVAKRSIPTESEWYQARYVHPDWYRTGDTETSIGHQTSTGLQPQAVRDRDWLESATLPIVKRCIEVNMSHGRYSIVSELLERLTVYVEGLAAQQRVETALTLVADVFSWFEKPLFVNAPQADGKELLEYLDICDRLARMPIGVLVAYGEIAETLSRELVVRRIGEIEWKSQKGIYRAGFGLHALERLEWLRPRLNFEVRVEGRMVTPPWYIQELITQKEVENLHRVFSCFYGEAAALYEGWEKTTEAGGHWWLSAAIMARESEYWNKLNHRTGALFQKWSDLVRDRRIEGLDWPSVEVEDLSNMKDRRVKALLKSMAEGNIRLSVLSRPESYPDFSGRFLHDVGEALLDAMWRNDSDTVDDIFHSYFVGSLLQFDRLKPTDITAAGRDMVDIKVAASPLLDLMEISGYAYLISEYYDTTVMKETVANEWDKYLTQATAPRIKFLAASVALTESSFELPHRSINRTRWRQVAERRFVELERKEILRGKDGSGWPELIVCHRSPLVRLFAEAYSEFDGIDMFLAKYVRVRDDGEGLDFGRLRERDLREEIDREHSRSEGWEA